LKKGHCRFGKGRIFPKTSLCIGGNKEKKAEDKVCIKEKLLLLATEPTRLIPFRCQWHQQIPGKGGITPSSTKKVEGLQKIAYKTTGGRRKAVGLEIFL